MIKKINTDVFGEAERLFQSLTVLGKKLLWR
jgi:hypothetical protein